MTPAAAGPGWLLAAPHRLAFAAGAALAIVLATSWALATALTALGTGPAPALPRALTHALTMAYGPLPLFFAGFIFTAGPRWLGLEGPPAPALRLPVLAIVVGALVVQAAAWLPAPLHPSAAVAAAIGMGLITLGWAKLGWRLAALLRASGAPDRLHLRLVALASGLGLLAMAGTTVALTLGLVGLARSLTLAALWGFLGGVFVAVAHRMIPFFAEPPGLGGDRIDAPRWMLVLLLAVLALQALTQLAGPGGPLPAPPAGLASALLGARAAWSLAVGSVLTLLALRWARSHAFRQRMLTMLWGGFAWFGLWLLLEGLSLALQAGSRAGLGLAPLHAYTMGFIGSTMMAMVGRVSAGHGGRTLAADRWLWRCYLGLQAAVLCRLAAALLPGVGAPATALAAFLWLLAVGAWAARHLRWYLSPRPDGRPG